MGTVPDAQRLGKHESVRGGRGPREFHSLHRGRRVRRGLGPKFPLPGIQGLHCTEWRLCPWRFRTFAPGGE